MTEVRRAGRHAAASPTAPTVPDDVEPAAAWVPPPYEPYRPGDFVEFASTAFQVRPSRRWLKVVLVLVLAAALAAGGWWYLGHRSTRSSAMSCQDVYANMPTGLQHYLHVTDGGRLPKGIPLPIGTPGRRCTASTKNGPGVLLVWPDASESEYAPLLAAGGWSSSRNIADYTVYANGGDRREVLTTTINGQLVALYDR